MQKFYLVFLIILCHLAVYAQPRPVECIKDTVVFADAGSCSRRVEKIEPYLIRDIPLKEVTYRLEGATTGEGVGSASGTVFKAGTTTVTYTAIRNKNYRCSFTVTVVAKEAITPEKNPLPEISLNCPDSLKAVPFAYYKCTDEKIYATTSDRRTFTKAGPYVILWKYYVHGLLVGEQKQQVTVHDIFTPRINQLRDLTGDCIVRVTENPAGVFRCSGEEIKAKTTDPMEYRKAGTHTINWTYVYQNDVIYRQTQKIIVTPRAKLVPTVQELKLLTDTCSVTISELPTARETCSDSLITAIPLGPLRYDTPGLHTLTWRYIYNKDTLEQKQQIRVIKGGFKFDVDSLKTIHASCSITITDKPTASHSCTKSKIMAVNLDPLRYDQPGDYKLRWMYVYNKDTVIQVQQVHVKAVRLAPHKDSLGAAYGACSVEVKKHPTARNCSGDSITATPLDPLKYEKPGRYTIRWFYKDKQDTLTQYQQVIVEAGRLTPDSNSLSPINASCSVVVNKKPTAIYNCDQTLVTAGTLDPLKYEIPGTYYIRWSFIYKLDTVVRIQQVNLKAGRIAPMTDTLPLISRACSVEIMKYPTATSCSGSLITAIPLDSVRYDKPGRYTIRWFYKDKQDTLTQHQQVIVEAGRLIPDSNSLSPINAGCSVVVNKKPTAMYSCDKTVVTAGTVDPLKYDIPGTYYIRWSFIHKLDTVIRIQQVNVKAVKIAPVMDTLPKIIGNCSVAVTRYPTAMGCSGDVITAIPLDTLKYDQPGHYTIRWFYRNNQDTLTQSQQVTVNHGKLIPDVETLPTITQGCVVELTKIPTATQTCTGKLVNGIALDPMKYDKPGSYRIRWRYIDNRDTVIQHQIVNVTEGGKLIPDIDSLSLIAGDCSVTVAKIPTATNTCTGDRVQATTTDPTHYTQKGKYQIRWRYTTSRDTLEQLQSVEVRSGQFLTPDVETLPALSNRCSITITEKPTARNNCSGKSITGTTTDPLSYNKPGHYTITWIYKDDGTAMITQEQKVMIETSQRLTPDVAHLPELTGDCSVSVTKPTATNTCTGEVITGSTTDPLVYTNPGQYIIQWKYYNSDLDSLIQTQKVTIRSSNRITPQVANLPVLEEYCSVVITDPPLAINRCTQKIIKASTKDALTYKVPGEYTVEWTFTDNNDMLVQTQKIIVKNKLTPLEALLPDIQGECEVKIYKIPIAVNSCNKLIRATTNDPLIYSVPGTYTIIWIFKDGDITLTQTQKVTVLKRELSVKVYPNPTIDEFLIYAKTCQRDEKLDLRMYDITGRLVEARQVNVNQEVRFGSGYPASMYIAHIIWNEKRYVYKLIKSR